jgi:hypothetical protein
LEHQDAPTGAIAPQSVGIARLGIGLLQGIVAWRLLAVVAPRFYDGTPTRAPVLWWSQAHPTLFAILALVTAFVPVIALAEIGRMRASHLIVYLLATSAALAALVAYDLWRDPTRGEVVNVWPSAGLMFGAAIGLFITNQLLEHRERRLGLFTAYATHFEDSWMRGFQVILSLAFTLLVWGVLELGNALFGLIQVAWFGQMIDHNWFRCPVLAVAFAASVHITDVRPALLRGMRNLGLTLLSWLLPLVVALGCAFLVALLFTGLHPLWNTRFAASVLLWSVAVTLVLLNAAYNDGDPAHWPVLPLRWAGRLAGPMMLVLGLLAAYAIGLRVGQHGWTPQRVRSAAVVLVALIYGGGYSWATLTRGAWLHRLERVNVTASLVMLGVLVALFTPLADPARLAVNSQVRQLKAGTIAPDKFDYQFLRFDAGRFGTDALAALTRNANGEIASRARLAQASDQRVFNGDHDPDPGLTEPALSHVTVYPAGVHLPGDFGPATIVQRATVGRDCLYDGSACDIIVWTVSAHAAPLLIVRQHEVWEDRPQNNARLTAKNRLTAITTAMGLPVFGRDPAAKWKQVGSIDHANCPGVFEALRNGKAETITPDHSDLLAGGFRLAFTPMTDTDARCQPERPAPAKPAPTDASAPSQMGPAFGSPGGL